jgi:hypothetical protein
MEQNLPRAPSAGVLPQHTERAPRRPRDGGPRVLIVTAHDAAEYLAGSLHEAGACVQVLCPGRNMMTRLPFVEKHYPYSAFHPLSAMRKAIAAAEPDLVIPCDDHVASQLHRLYEDASGDDKMRSLLTASLGNPENFPQFLSRVDVCRLAREMDLPCPETVPVLRKSDYRRKLDAFGLPAVLKIDLSWGGNGVAILRTAAEARRAFPRLRDYPGWPRALKRLLRDGDGRLMQQILDGRKNRLSLQRHVEGRRANAAVACWQGEVLAAVLVDVLASDSPTGPATLVRVITDPGISATVEKMVATLKLSGLCGFDFIRPADGGPAQLLELNPRVTPTSHLVTADGKGLAMALCARWRGDSVPPARLAPNFDPVRTFPPGLRRMDKRPFPATFPKASGPDLLKLKPEINAADQ